MIYSRPCNECGISKPLTHTYWHVNGNAAGGFASQCKDCRNKEGFRHRRARELRAQSEARGDYHHHSEKKLANHCNACLDLPWRVQGIACHECGLKFALEPRPEFVLWRRTG